LGTDQVGIFCFPLVLIEFSGWYDPGPTISEVEFNRIRGSNPFTARLEYKLNWGEVCAYGLIAGSYSGPGVILYFFWSIGNLEAPPNLVLPKCSLLTLSA